MQNERPDIPAVVVGFETNGLGVARALSMAGIRVIGISQPYPHAATWTRSAKVRQLPEWTESALVAELRRLGQELPPRSPLLITKDECVGWISAHRDELSKFFHIILPEADTIDLLMSKQQFQDLAENEGWPAPRTWQVNSNADLDAALPAIPLPAILKPRVKNSIFRAKAPRKAYVCQSLEELRDNYRLVAQWEPEVVIQEFIGGGDDRIAFCLGYWGERHEPEILFSGRKLRQWPILSGNTALCEPAPAEWAAKIEPLTKVIFSKVRFRGLGSIEYKMRPGSDEPVLIEPTVGRTNYQNEVAVVNGYNIPLVAYRHALGEEIPQPTPSPKPIQLIDELTATRAAEAYQARGLMGSADCAAQIRGEQRRMLFRASDPAPYLVWTSRSVWQGLRQSIKPRSGQR
jgi:predicted ATP-grasp superfamily ATP-dependent carboligase